MQLLIADDDPTALAINRHLAASVGHAVTVATDGAAALTAIATGQFDAALLDLYMPVMDGTAVAQAARAALPPERRPRLIALTTAGPPGGEEAISALGFDSYLTKPLSLAALDAA
jgi:CheY-like chemotaxis protein